MHNVKVYHHMPLYSSILAIIIHTFIVEYRVVAWWPEQEEDNLNNLPVKQQPSTKSSPDTSLYRPPNQTITISCSEPL